jgi:hypothetical protein
MRSSPTDAFAPNGSRPPLPIWQDNESYGRLLSEDPERAADWARRAAVAGERRVQVTWGHMLLTGHGVAADPAAALRWFRSAAKAGDAEGANMLGRCYELGLGTQRDVVEAAAWYRIAADANDPWGCFNLASLLLQRDASAATAKTALSLLVRSARRGNAKAMNMIGRWLEEGWTGHVKPDAAPRWYLRAARRGCFRAQFHTARLLLRAGNVEQAASWVEKCLHIAPPEFRADVIQFLGRHDDARVRQLIELASLQPSRALEAVIPEPSKPHVRAQKPSLLKRWRHARKYAFRRAARLRQPHRA